MIILTIILTFMLIAYYYIFCKKDILSPTLILFAAFTFTSFFGVLGNTNWNVNISVSIYFIVISGLIAFALGEITIKISNSVKEIDECVFNRYEKKNYKISIGIIVLFTLFGMIIFYLYLKKMNVIASKYGFLGSLSFSALEYAKVGLSDGVDIGYISYLVNFVYATGYVSIYCFCYESILNKDTIKQNIYLLMPCIPQLLCHAISGSRNGFITFIVYFFFCYFLIYYKVYPRKDKDTISTRKIIAIIVSSMIVFFALFQFLGEFLGKTGVRTPLEMLYLYTGSSIPALSKYVENGVIHSNFFGSESFVGIVNHFHRIFGTPAGVKVLNHVRFANRSTTNIFTCYRQYIDDFGYWGLWLIMYIQGFVFSYTYSRIKHRKHIGFNIIVYSYYMYYLISSIFAASTTIYFMSRAFISLFLCIGIIYLFFTRVRITLKKHRRNYDE